MIPTLITKLERAEGGSRELDAEIAILLVPEFAGWIKHPNLKADSPAWMQGELWPDYQQFHEWLMGNGASPSEQAPAITGSVDAAVALVDHVLPGAEYEITTLYGVALVTLPMNFTDIDQQVGRREDGNVPIAICIAALRALQAKEDGR